MLVNWADVLDGEIVNAAWAVAGMVARPRASRRVAADLDTAAWADTERLIRDALAAMTAEPDMPEPSDDEYDELEEALKGAEAQGALRTLLACRLTDAQEADAAQARLAIRLALGGTAAPLAELPPLRSGQGIAGKAGTASGYGSRDRFAWFCAALSEFLDERVCALVAALEGRAGFAALAQVRAEAYNARIVALLGAIERQVASITGPSWRPGGEREFLERYRRQAHLRHGFLTPPDFDRRRRVPVADIYVPTRINDEDQAERTGLTRTAQPDAPKVWDLVDRLDRTVLLGDPGGGKTTAANVLTNHFTTNADRRVPFLVTLREYAGKAPIKWSVAEHIEHNLKTLYQSPAPDGLVERLLLTGRAVVIFDGLDELLDTARRRDVTDRVEQFCAAYQLTPVLVTSRVVGYDQARLDDAQFTCYRLGGFSDDDVATYARKWFTSQEGVVAAEAQAKAAAFLGESANARDLRSNPLLLSLMCILYRGAGSLPADRAGIYAKCAELLLRKWDEQRDLYRQVKADHLVEPTIRYLAWWLFTRQDSRAETTERELAAKAAEFLYERGYETVEEARAAAQEFIDFCRGRMWVFSEVGTTASGDKLYAFTHRTFMEYFAAGHLAATSDTPEQLALTLAPHIHTLAWMTVGELAIQIKESGTDRASNRIYATLLDQPRRNLDPLHSLTFLALCVSSSCPSPATVRRLTRAVLDEAFTFEFRVGVSIARTLVAYSREYEPYVYDEMGIRIETMAASDDPDTRAQGLLFVLKMTQGFRHSTWRPWADEQISKHRATVLDAAARDIDFRLCATSVNAISVEQALTMPGGLSVLFRDRNLIGTYLAKLTADDENVSQAFAAIGRFLTGHPHLPWVSAPLYDDPLPLFTVQVPTLLDIFGGRDEFTGLGLAASIAIGSELSDTPTFRQVYRLTELPIPARFRKLFHDWTAGHVELAATTGK